MPPGWTKATTFAPGLNLLGDMSDPHRIGLNTVRAVRLTWNVDGSQDPDCQKDWLVFLARIELLSPVGDLSYPVNRCVSVVDWPRPDASAASSKQSRLRRMLHPG